MSAQYDEIAEDFQKSRGLAIFEVIGYTLMQHLGDVTGKTVLDLACGEGINARIIKQAGAARVVGVDESKEMIRLAEAEEAKEPLGIEYIQSSVQELGKVDEFDIITAVFLLNYATNREDLRQMCQVIYDNLKPGERFLTINDNGGEGARRPHAFRKYGFSYVPPEPMTEGSQIHFTLDTGFNTVEFDFSYLSRETYEWGLKEVGFKSVRWHPLMLPPHLEAEKGKEFWDYLFEISPVVLIECEK
jgi:ubiquinone/menaquinone biosynthesis C-methylase UbiE